MKLKTLLLGTLAILISFSANAARVGIIGDYLSIGTANHYLGDFGHKVIKIDTADTLNLNELDVLILGRHTRGNEDIASFINKGGMLITEWESAKYALELLGGTTERIDYPYHTNDSIVFSTEALAAGLGKDLGDSYANLGATEHFQNMTSAGSGAIYAYRGSDNSAAAIIGGQYGEGFVWANGFDWADIGDRGADALLSFTLINNEINSKFGNTVPEPGSLALFAFALIGFVASRQRKQ